MPRVVDRVLGRKKFDASLVAGLFSVLFDAKGLDPAVTRAVLEVLAKKVQTGEIAGPAAQALRDRLAPALQKVFAGGSEGPLALDAAALAATLKDPAALALVREVADDAKRPEGDRLKALNALVAAKDSAALVAAAAMLSAAPKGLGGLPRPGARRPGRRWKKPASPRSCWPPTRPWSRTSSRGPSNC